MMKEHVRFILGKESLAHRFELLALVTRFMYTVPCSSVPSKRIFSRPGLVREKQRGALIPASAGTILQVGEYLCREGMIPLN